MNSTIEFPDELLSRHAILLAAAFALKRILVHRVPHDAQGIARTEKANERHIGTDLNLDDAGMLAGFDLDLTELLKTRNGKLRCPRSSITCVISEQRAVVRRLNRDIGQTIAHMEEESELEKAQTECHDER